MQAGSRDLRSVVQEAIALLNDMIAKSNQVEAERMLWIVGELEELMQLPEADGDAWTTGIARATQIIDLLRSLAQFVLQFFQWPS